eukprot:8012439-Alexandrium_andersonii.AAC.1
MSASLVGSDMCIRDSSSAAQRPMPPAAAPPANASGVPTGLELPPVGTGCAPAGLLSRALILLPMLCSC